MTPAPDGAREPLTEYDTEADAACGADYAKREYGSSLVPYRGDRCSRASLASQPPHAVPAVPLVRGPGGEVDGRLRRPEAAKRRAEIQFEEQGVRLRAYPCDYGGGWRLTKSERIPPPGRLHPWQGDACTLCI